jgi:hypothetical protein
VTAISPAKPSTITIHRPRTHHGESGSSSSADACAAMSMIYPNCVAFRQHRPRLAQCAYRTAMPDAVFG